MQGTIEEKIVERAQKKLKLDAMVVQQGRLQNKVRQAGRQHGEPLRMLMTVATNMGILLVDMVTCSSIIALLTPCTFSSPPISYHSLRTR